VLVFQQQTKHIWLLDIIDHHVIYWRQICFTNAHKYLPDNARMEARRRYIYSSCLETMGYF